MAAYYNEFNKDAAAWLRVLIQEGLIAHGYVDERSIEEVTPGDLRGFTQCHFFAGIGGWSLALRIAGVRDDSPCWTGSPPCQPFSVAGKQIGMDDPRHLAPIWLRLIEQCQPAKIFGEQVKAAIKPGWLDLLFLEMERAGYACGASVLPAGAVEAPHLRDRLFFGAVRNLAHTRHAESPIASGWSDGGMVPGGRFEAAEEAAGCGGAGEIGILGDSDIIRRKHEQEITSSYRKGMEQAERIKINAGYSGCKTGELGDADCERREGQRLQHQQRAEDPEIAGSGKTGELADEQRDGSQGWLRGWQDSQRQTFGGQAGRGSAACDLAHAFNGSRIGRQQGPTIWQHEATAGAVQAVNPWASLKRQWDRCDWILCLDGNYRPIEPGTFPLANGVPARVGRLRGYGNAISPQITAEFIEAFNGACRDARKT